MTLRRCHPSGRDPASDTQQQRNLSLSFFLSNPQPEESTGFTEDSVTSQQGLPELSAPAKSVPVPKLGDTVPRARWNSLLRGAYSNASGSGPERAPILLAAPSSPAGGKSQTLRLFLK